MTPTRRSDRPKGRDPRDVRPATPRPRSKTPPDPPGERPPAFPPLRHERLWVAGLLFLHLTLVVWGAVRNSVAYDENYHLPAGVLEVTQGDFTVSTVNPPLIKALCALPAIAAGAQAPDPQLVATHDQQAVAIGFMRANRDRYFRLFVGARLVIALLSVVLGLLVWWFSRRLHGPMGALLSLGFYALTPDVLAHAGVVGMDVATGLALLACVLTWWTFTRTGQWRDLAWACGAIGFASLVRFTSWLFLIVLVVLAGLATLFGWARRPARLWLGVVALVPAMLIALQIGYAGQTSLTPLGSLTLVSPAFRSLQRSMPGVALPLPDSYIAGLDQQALDTSSELRADTYLFGRIRSDRVWWYTPIALLVKWPLGLLAALLVRAVQWMLRRARDLPVRDHVFLLLPPAALLASTMFLAQINVGVRYVLPMLPLLCVWLGGLTRPASGDAVGSRPSWVAWAPAALVVVVAIETLACAPWYLSFYNVLAGGPGNGDRIVNDSNVDWGQGLIGLRDELRRRGIGKVYLTYHGTADPKLYGIDYEPYIGGPPGDASEWLAVSSYYFRGLGQRMTTMEYVSKVLWFDFQPMWSVTPVARPAHCMYLFHLGHGTPRVPGRIVRVGS